jgi:hypothetical protein
MIRSGSGTSLSRSLPLLVLVSAPNPAGMPCRRAAPVAGYMPSAMSISTAGESVSEPPVSAINANSSSLSWLPCA